MGMHGRSRRMHTASSQRRRRREWFALDRDPHRAGRTIVVGLGDPSRGPRSASLAVASALQAMLESQPVAGVEVARSDRGGTDLVGLLSGFERAVLVDCVHVDAAGPEAVQRVEAWPCGRTLEPSSAVHAEELRQALAWATQMGLPMPRPLEVVAVPGDVAPQSNLGRRVIPSVAKAIHEWLGHPTGPLRVVDRV